MVLKIGYLVDNCLEFNCVCVHQRVCGLVINNLDAV